MAEMKINVSEKTVFVFDFLGFTEDWDEIIVPVDRETIRALEAQGYTIDYASDDI